MPSSKPKQQPPKQPPAQGGGDGRRKNGGSGVSDAAATAGAQDTRTRERRRGRGVDPEAGSPPPAPGGYGATGLSPPIDVSLLRGGSSAKGKGGGMEESKQPGGGPRPQGGKQARPSSLSGYQSVPPPPPPPLQVPGMMIGESAELMEEAGLYDVQALNRRILASSSAAGAASAAAAAAAAAGGGGPGVGPGAGEEGGAPGSSSIPRVVVCPSTFGSNSGASDISPLTSKTGGHASWARQMTMLILISILPFGGHFVKNCLASLEVYLIQDPRLHLTETRYGLLLSMTSLPNFFIPFLGGVFLDKRGHRFATLLFLFLVLIGQIIFTIAIQLGDFQMAMVGRVVLGLGEGSVVVAQRAVISHVFKAKSQVTFAVGVSVAMACLSKTLSRATVVPAAAFLGGYVGGLWYTVVVCLLSTLAGVVFIILSDEREDPFERRRNKSVSYAESFLGSPLDLPPGIGGIGASGGGGLGSSGAGTGGGAGQGAGGGNPLQTSNSGAMSINTSHTPTYHSMLAVRETAFTLSGAFWALCLLHSIYINVFHIFLNFSAHYFTSPAFGRDPKTAALLTSSASVLVIFLGPLVGYIMDRVGGQLYVCSATSLLVVLAYYWLAFRTQTVDPLYDMALLSVGESFIPILVMALIPFTVPKKAYGTAYGIVEVMGAVTSFAGNVLIGYLIDRAGGGYGPAMLALTALAAGGAACFFALLVGEVWCGHRGLNTRHAIDYEALAAIDE